MSEAVSTPDPVQLARSGESETLEKVWLEEMEKPGELGRYLSALDVLIEVSETERVNVLAGMLAEALHEAGRSADVLAVLEHLASHGVAEVTGIEEPCGKSLEATYGQEPWFEWMIGKAGITLGEISWDSYLAFHRCTAFLPGKAVMHGSGWGEGLIADLHPDRDEVEIHFASGKRHTVPWQSALDTMEPLPAWDLRGLRLRDPEELTRLTKKNPLEILRRALKVFRGKSTSSQLKEFLHEKVVPAKSWATWWRKAKAAAVEDPLIAVDGSPTRPTFTLRKKALTLVEEARGVLRHENRIESILRTLRAFLDRATRDEDRASLSELARECLGGLAATGQPDADTVQALIFLEELGQVTEEQAVTVVGEFLRAGASEPDYRRLAKIPEPQLRCRVVRMLPRIFGAHWHQNAATQLSQIPERCEDSLELLVDLIRERREPDLLIDAYESIAPFPAKHPFLLYLLTKTYSEGALEGASRSPNPNVVCRVALHVLRVVSDGRRTRLQRTRLQNRMLTVLLGKRGLLPRLLEEADQRTIESALRAVHSAGPDFPVKVQELVERTVRERFPDLLQVPERPVWDDGGRIFTTRKGFEARRQEFLHLRNVLIPENSEAIGAAASQGDLSENAEWDAAMEEQRNLTAKAAEWEEELKRVQFLEEMHLPADRVVPGSRVRLLELDGGEERTLRILGPWDGVLGGDVVSYRAPLATSLLGKRPQDEVTVELPSGLVRLRVIEVEPLY